MLIIPTVTPGQNGVVSNKGARGDDNSEFISQPEDITSPEGGHDMNLLLQSKTSP
jgi:hypothetical protein